MAATLDKRQFVAEESSEAECGRQRIDLAHAVVRKLVGGPSKPSIKMAVVTLTRRTVRDHMLSHAAGQRVLCSGADEAIGRRQSSVGRDASKEPQMQTTDCCVVLGTPP